MSSAAALFHDGPIRQNSRALAYEWGSDDMAADTEAEADEDDAMVRLILLCWE